MKYIITENKLEKTILHFLDKGYGDLTEYKTDEYPNYIFYIKDKILYMAQDIEEGVLWVDEHTIWSDLKNLFSLEDDGIQSVITKWVEETYNIKDIIIGISEFWPAELETMMYNIKK